MSNRSHVVRFATIVGLNDLWLCVSLPGSRMPTLNEVFGINSAIPTYTYVDRQGLDGRFQYLLSTNRHIVLYGASKQGKTSLRRKQLPEDRSLVIPCKPDFKVEDIYLEIRRQLGLSDTAQHRVKKILSGGTNVDAKGKAGIPFFAEGEITAKGNINAARESESTKVPVQNGLSLVALAGEINRAGKRIILEDFHYLAEDERRRLAFDLKTFWDYSVFFIVVGVWAEQNLLTVYNNDLSGRVEEIDVRWSDDDLRLVLNRGERALDFCLSENIKAQMVTDSNGNVGLLQRIAEQVCLSAGIVNSEAATAEIADQRHVESYRSSICSGQEIRYHGFVELVSKGFKDPERTKLKMYHHLVRVCFMADEQELLLGLDRQVILSRIQKFEPDANMTVLSAALSRVNRLQAERRISPPVLCYNGIARNISLVDREFLFFRRNTKRAWPWDQPDYQEELERMTETDE